MIQRHWDDVVCLRVRTASYAPNCHFQYLKGSTVVDLGRHQPIVAHLLHTSNTTFLHLTTTPYDMHPNHYHWHEFGGHHRFHRGPSRLVWFIFGGVFASWWLHHKHNAHIGIEGSRCDTLNARRMHGSDFPQDRASNAESDNAIVGSGQEQQAPRAQWLPTSLPSHPAQEDKFRAFGNQAVDSMNELSEATLDGILTTVQSLKMKLAENRLARAKEQQQQQQQQQYEATQPSSLSSRGWDAVRRLV